MAGGGGGSLFGAFEERLGRVSGVVVGGDGPFVDV